MRFDQATAEDFRAYWEGQGWTVKQDAVMQCAHRNTANYFCIALVHWFRSGRKEVSLLDGPWGEPVNCMDLAELPAVTTFDQALDILNELANTRAFGGWAEASGE